MNAYGRLHVSTFDPHVEVAVRAAYRVGSGLVASGQIIIIIIIYTTYIAPYIWPVSPFIGAEEGPSKY